MALVETASAETDSGAAARGHRRRSRVALRPVPKLVTAGLCRPDVSLLEHLTVAAEAAGTFRRSTRLSHLPWS